MARKIDLETVKCTIEDEGIGYTITSMYGPEQMETKELEKLWTDARKAIKKIIDYLEVEAY